MFSIIQRVHLQKNYVWRLGAEKIRELNSQPWMVFAREWLQAPCLAGAVCPSSCALAKAMADYVPDGAGLVVDLGAGTGAVVMALLRKGIPPHRIVAVEQSAQLARYLRGRFPEIMVLRGDAARLSRILPKGPVDCIVSSLPLVSLPQAKREAVVRELKLVLQGRPLVQFSYLWGGAFLVRNGLMCINSKLVLKNLPPARVMKFV